MSDITFPTYNTRVQVLKREGEAAKSEWDRFRNNPASPVKLDALQKYISALKAEYNYRKNRWNSDWGTQNPGHEQRICVLERDIIELERQEALLDREVNDQHWGHYHDEL